MVLRSIKNSSVVTVFSFLKAFPASLNDPQDVNKRNIMIIFIFHFLFLKTISFININIIPKDIKISAALKVNQ